MFSDNLGGRQENSGKLLQKTYFQELSGTRIQRFNVTRIQGFSNMFVKYFVSDNTFLSAEVFWRQAFSGGLY